MSYIQSSSSQALALIKALGVEDPRNVTRVVLTLDAGKVALLQVTRLVPGDIVPKVQALNLRAVDPEGGNS